MIEDTWKDAARNKTGKAIPPSSIFTKWMVLIVLLEMLSLRRALATYAYSVISISSFELAGKFFSFG